MAPALYSLALELTLILAFWVALGAWQTDRGTPGRLSFAALGLAVATWCAGLLVERTVGVELAYLGLVSAPPMWVGVAAVSARLEIARRVPWLPLVLLLPLLALRAMLHLGPWSPLFPAVDLKAAGAPGPLWGVHAVYWHGLMATGTLLLIWRPLRGKPSALGLAWPQVAALGSLLPLMGSAWSLVSGTSGSQDPVPILFAPFLLLLRSAVFGGGLLQALPISQAALIDQLPIGVILTDRKGTVIAINPAAQRRLEIPEEQALARTVDAVFHDAGSSLRVETVPVSSGGREVGQLLLLDGAPPKSEGGARRQVRWQPPRS